MHSFVHTMCNWSYLLLAVHFASAAFINTNLHAPLAGVVPNQLRIYREYQVQHKDANTELSENSNEEREKILVNCTIRSTNVKDKDTDKIIKKTVANCTETHDSIGPERKAEDSMIGEQRVNKIEQEIQEVGNGFTMQHQRPNNLPHINVTDDAYGSVNEKPESETRKATDELDRGNSESEKRIPVIIEAVASHNQGVSKVGVQNFKVSIEKTNHTSESTLIRSSEQEKTMADDNMVLKNNEQEKEALEDSVQNANQESPLTFRRAHTVSSMTNLINGSTQNLNITEEKSSDVSIVASPRMDETKQNTLRVSGNSVSSELPNENRQALNTEYSIVKSDTDEIQRFITENAPTSFNQYYPLSNYYDYSFDNSGRLIGKQTPYNINYRASTSIGESLQRQPENTTNKPILDLQYANEQSPEQLYSTLALVKNESLNNQDSRSAKEKSIERQILKNTPKSLAEFIKEHTQNANNLNKERLAYVRTIGSSQVTPDINDRAGNLMFPSLKVANGHVARTGNEYPLAVQVQRITINSKQNPSQLSQRINYFNTNAKPTFAQNLGQRTPSYVKDSALRQWQRFGYFDSQSAACIHLNQPGGIWDSVNDPHQVTIWDTLKDATNKVYKWFN